MKLAISGAQSLSNLHEFFKDLPHEARTIIGYRGSQAAARIVINQARKSITFKSRHGVFGLAGTFRVISDARKFRVWANYGGPGNKHGHLIELGTSRGAKAHHILTKAIRARERDMQQSATKAMQRELNKLVNQYKSGRVTRQTASFYRKLERLGSV